MSGTRSKSVVIGIIDDGIAFANACFRRANGSTRVEYFWNQNNNIPGATPPQPPGLPWSYGHEINKQTIDTNLAASAFPPPNGPVDEAKVYRLSKLVDYAVGLHKAAGWRIAHGTHTLSLAAGHPMSDDRSDRPIIGVQLPVAGTADQSGAKLKTYVADAVHYILHRALTLTKQNEPPLPVVINFSYAVHDGPHDGTFILERVFEKAIARAGRPVQIVLPAGNTLQARCHAQTTFGRATNMPLSLRVQPDGLRATALSIWLPYSGPKAPAASRVTLTLATPDGTVSSPLTETLGAAATLMTPTGGVYAVAQYDFDSRATQRSCFEITINPTARLLWAPETPIAPSGLWTITLRNTGLDQNAVVEAWVERDDLIYGYPRRGRQAYFDDLNYLRYDPQGRPVYDDPPPPAVAAPSYVLRNGMINGIATGATPVVAGGFIVKTLQADIFSAGGPDEAPHGGVRVVPSPGAVLPSDESRVHTGIFAAGTRSGSVVALSGTSMSCAQLTRMSARLLAGGTLPNHVAVEGAATVPSGTPTLPSARSGAGCITRPAPTNGWETRYWS